MNTQRASRLLVSYISTMKSNMRLVRHKSQQACTGHMNARNLSLASNARQQVAFAEESLPDSVIAWATAGKETLRVEFGDGSVNEMPYHFLRSNCRCSKCTRSLTGSNIMTNHQTEIQPEIIQRRDYGLVVDWSDGHISRYTADWLRAAEFVNAHAYNMHTYAEAT
ncbi:hypothetical protein SK128_000252 [Halocaridina rubra]|uniref:Gamma-butyrobetaine hydroxylase-like N-terminal domain-containing protein n=1 Tax=Halocaridina rubra TaxID=373956 RepID=A0AAN8X3R5_HALRR